MKMEKKTMKIKKKLMKKKIKYKFKFRLNKKKFLLNNCLYKLFIIFFLVSLYIFFLYNINQVKIITVKDSIFQEIVSFENNLNLTPQIFDEFRKINCDNKLLEENIKFKKSWFPDVSIIITIYNQAEYIHKVLRSVQNQSLKNIEIIFIDDCSLDNSLEIIKEYQKEDERIILISHDTNEGEIKSRTDGIRKAKGKYITIIDGDDALIHKDILKNSLYIAQKANLDVVEFRAREYSGKYKQKFLYDYTHLNVAHILYQPELREKFFQKINKNKYYLMNRVIWAKLIKGNVFKALLDYIGSEYVDDYINEAEDTLMAVGLFNFAKSYYVMKEEGYYYSFEDKKQAKIIENKVCKVNNKLKKIGFFKYLKFLIEHTIMNDDDKIRTYNEFSVLDLKKIFKTILDDRHYKLIFYVLDKLLEWNCLEPSQRTNIINFKNKVIDKRNKDNNTNIN